jgi:hypothetical protein
MLHCQVVVRGGVVGGGGRVLANILNKQSWTDEGGDLPVAGFGVGLTTSNCKKTSTLSNVTQGLRLEQIRWKIQVLENGPEIWSKEFEWSASLMVAEGSCNRIS